MMYESTVIRILYVQFVCSICLAVSCSMLFGRGLCVLVLLNQLNNLNIGIACILISQHCMSS
jgi:hypothetical protein